jgi:hypothetical protein
MVQTPTPPGASTAKPSTTYLQERQETINWLRRHNYPVLPVAPLQEPYSSGNHKIISENLSKGIWSHCPLTASLQPIPLYTGKNPSYLDSYGKPHLVNHRQYQNKLPSAQDLKKWFANPLNGVGTLGGWNNTVWLDFDVKQFPSQEECNKAALQVAACAQQQTGFDALLEESHSGGWRVGVRDARRPELYKLRPHTGRQPRWRSARYGQIYRTCPNDWPIG